MSIQPGVGLNFKESSHGTTLDIEQGWTPFVPSNSDTIPDGGDGGGDQIPPNKVIFSKMRVICRTGGMTGGCLREYNLVGMAVYPTGSKTAATTANTDLLDDGATFTLVPPVSPATTKEYVFSVILNQYNITSSPLQAGIPYAALMEVGGDAYTKTTPWLEESDCDRQTWTTAFQYAPVSISIPDAPFEVNGNLEIAQQDKLKNYNCQRLRIATIFWNNTTGKWVLTQHLLGPITIPYNIFYEGPYRWTEEDFTPPSWWTTPDYQTEQEAWEGDYFGSTKWSGGTNPTQSITV